MAVLRYVFTMFDDRLLTEALRCYEQLAVEPITDADAARAARAVDSDFEGRLIARAKHVLIASELRDAMGLVRRMTIWVVMMGLILAGLAGLATVRASLGIARDGPVNFFWLVGSILGLQTIMLAFWFVLMLAKPSAPSGLTLGAAVLGLARRVAVWINNRPELVAAVRATTGVMAGDRIGRWTVGLISHMLWLAFNVSCLIMLIVMLSTRHYTFAWETTILSGDFFARFTETLAWLPQHLGFAVPTHDQIVTSEINVANTQHDVVREAWSGLLLGCVVIYGLAPRLLMMALCLNRRRAALRAFRLDTSKPEYAKLQARLMPESQRIGIVDHDDTKPTDRITSKETSDSISRSVGLPAIVGLEIDTPACNWPPSVDDMRWQDIGLIDGREQQQAALELLETADSEPATLLIVCELTTTPDRGLAVSIQRLCAAVNRPAALLLTAGDQLRKRGDSDFVQSRIEDWRKLAHELNFQSERIVELDLDHLTNTNRARLAALVGQGDQTISDRKLESAFHHIVIHAENWREFPKLVERAELHRAIAKEYGEEVSQSTGRFKLELSSAGDLTRQLRSGAERMTALLPPGLKQSPKWLAAGAAAGALGCVAASTLIFPAAIAALPMWSALGAAIAGVLKTIQPSQSETIAAEEPSMFADAVRCAVLHAIVLELQGHSESAIARILDSTVAISDENDASLETSDQVHIWLDDLRHRFDLAVTNEQRERTQ